jgi:hypothetical protein
MSRQPNFCPSPSTRARNSRKGVAAFVSRSSCVINRHLHAESKFRRHALRPAGIGAASMKAIKRAVDL